MEKIKAFIEQADTFLKPYIDKVIDFLSKEYYVVYAAIAALLVFLVIPGLFSFIKKAPKTFLLIIILLAAAGLIAYFISYKA